MISFIVLFLSEFAHLLVEVVPFFIIGIAAGALLESKINTDRLVQLIDKGLGPVINGSLLGVLLPGCACATVPLAEGLKAKGAKLGTLSAFMMASPLLAPQTLVLTLGMLGTSFALGRLVFAVVGSVIFGYVCHWLSHRKTPGFQLNSEKAKSCCHNTTQKTPSFFASFWAITKDLGTYFLLGLVIATLFSILVPPELIPSVVGSSSPMAYILALILGIPMYVCEGEEIPVTAALIGLGLGPGPAMTFLLGSVGTCIPTYLMARKVVGIRPMNLYLAYWFVFALVSGLVYAWVV